MGFDITRLIKGERLKDTVGSVMVINLVLAATALIKDISLASYLGTSPQADAYLLALFLPDTAGNNLLAATFAVACIPVFSRLYVAGDPECLKQAMTRVTLYLSLVSMLVAALFYIERGALVGRLGAGLALEAKILCVQLLVIMLPAVAAFPIATIGAAVMQVHNRFDIPALGPVLFNAVYLGGIFITLFTGVPSGQGVYILAWSVLAGALSMVALNWISVRRFRIDAFVRPGKVWLKVNSPEIKEVIVIFLPYLLIMVAFQSVLAVERYLASGLAAGSIAGLNYAFRMAQFPLWVFVAAVSAVAFPSMSKATGAGRLTDLKETLARSVGLVFMITVPLAICLFILRVPAVSILLQRGSFDQSSVQITAGILAGYSLSIVPQAAVVICLRAFLALGRYYVPLLATAFSAGLNIALDFILVEALGSAGLGYGAAAGALANAVILLTLLNRQLGLGMAGRLGWLGRILAANLPVLLLAWAFLWAWQWVAGAGPAVRLAYALGLAAVVLPVYFAGLRLVRVTLKK